MGFLSGLGSVLGTAAGALGAGVGAYNLINPQENKDLKRSQQAAAANAAWMRALSESIADPTDPRFLALQESERELARKRYQAGLQDILRAHMRDRARGGPGYITNPERQDEMMWNNLARQRELDDPAARARAALQSAGSTAAGVTPAAQVAGGIAGLRENLGAEQRYGNWGILGEGLGTLGSGLENMFPQTFGASTPSPRLK